MPPEEIYRAVCMACHDTDGKGKIVRQAMPSIPDLTDAKWQASRKDSELQHSILEGKDSIINGVKLPLMLPMKDKLALAHTDVKDMVAFMRGFKDGKQVVSAMPGGTPAPVPGPIAEVAPQGSPLAPEPPSPVRTPPPGPAPPTTPGRTGGLLPPALPPVSTVNTAAQAEKLRAAGATFNTLCIACHGQDGRGSAVRVAMPVIPDFTTREWQTSRSNPQLSISILEGKGQLMPPWRGRVTPELAQDLIAFVRTFGPAGLTAPTTAKSEFAVRYKELQKQWDELNLQVQALSHP